MSSKLHSIQIARATAALLVVLGHTLKEALQTPNAAEGFHLIHDIANYGFGVDIFFVVSGFIMAYISEGRMGTPGYARYFLRSRLLRVVPLYWFYTSLLVAVTLIAPSLLDNARFDLRHILSSYLFYPWSPAPTGEAPAQPLLALGWTLNYEMMFYALYFVCLLFVPAKRMSLSLLLLFVSFSGIFFVTELTGTPFQFWFRPIILEFAAGLLIYEAFKAGWRLTSMQALALGGLSLVVWLVLPNVGLPLNIIGWRWLILGVPAMGFVAALALWTDADKERQGRFWRWGVSLGDASYSLYLSHPFVITVMFVLWSKLNLFASLGVFSYILATSAVSIAVAFASYRLVERPLSRAAGRRTTQTKTTKQPAS